MVVEDLPSLGKEPPSSLLPHEMIVKLISSEKNMSKFLIGSLIG